MEINEAQTINLEDIKILSWEEIKNEFDVSEKDMLKSLKIGTNSCDNFWYPSHDNDFTDEQVEMIRDIFVEKFNGIEINSYNNYKFLEIYLDTPEKHNFKYSLISYLKNVFE